MLRDFTGQISAGKIEVYNEASIQYELAILLRQKLGGDCRVQLERNIDFFALNKKDFLKKEMDIAVYKPNKEEKHCIELKFPTQGQYPEQMFSACKDVAFLEQLVLVGFDECYFVMFANDPLFYVDKGDSGIYLTFRRDKLIRDTIRKPTGDKKETLSVKGKYPIIWKDIVDSLRYFVVRVNSTSLQTI